MFLQISVRWLSIPFSFSLSLVSIQMLNASLIAWLRSSFLLPPDHTPVKSSLTGRHSSTPPHRCHLNTVQRLLRFLILCLPKDSLQKTSSLPLPSALPLLSVPKPQFPFLLIIPSRTDSQFSQFSFSSLPRQCSSSSAASRRTKKEEQQGLAPTSLFFPVFFVVSKMRCPHPASPPFSGFHFTFTRSCVYF